MGVGLNHGLMSVKILIAIKEIVESLARKMTAKCATHNPTNL
jgi:hypothetical protein